MNQFPSLCQKYIGYIMYIIGISIICSSCIIVNKSKPSSLEQVSKYDHRRLIITTIDGYRYKLYWIEEEGDCIKSIKNTKRIRIDINEPHQILLGGRIVSLDSAVTSSGIVELKTKNKNYQLLDIYIIDDHIIGIKKIGKEVLPVVIAKDQIKNIKVQNRGGSMAINIVAGIAIATGLFIVTVLAIYL